MFCTLTILFVGNVGNKLVENRINIKLLEKVEENSGEIYKMQEGHERKVCVATMDVMWLR